MCSNAEQLKVESMSSARVVAGFNNVETIM